MTSSRERKDRRDLRVIDCRPNLYECMSAGEERRRSFPLSALVPLLLILLAVLLIGLLSQA